MKKLSNILLISILAIFLVTGSAMATYISPISWDGDGKDLQSVLDNFANDGSIGLVAQGLVNDAIPYDEVWISGGLGSNTALVVEIAGNDWANKFGIYDPYNPSIFVQLFDGLDSPYTKKSLDVYGDGSIFVSDSDTGIDFTSVAFGFYLSGPDGTFYSESALNPNEMDQMVAFGPGDGIELLDFPAPLNKTAPWLKGEYILAFEDLNGELSNTYKTGNYSDYDYNDMIVMVESVQPKPIPEPATMLLFGTGLFGLAGIGRKKFFQKT